MSEPLEFWLREQTRWDPGAVVPKETLQRRYDDYATDHNLRPAPGDQMKNALRSLYPELGSTQRRIDGRFPRCWIGIRLRCA